MGGWHDVISAVGKWSLSIIPSPAPTSLSRTSEEINFRLSSRPNSLPCPLPAQSAPVTAAVALKRFQVTQEHLSELALPLDFRAESLCPSGRSDVITSVDLRGNSCCSEANLLRSWTLHTLEEDLFIWKLKTWF